MAYTVKVNHVSWKDESGESQVLSKGATFEADRVPAGRVKFWLAAGMIEETSEETTDA